MTIISAISDAGIIIKDGADGIKEFTTPTTLKKYNLTLSAPTNSTAIMASGSKVGTGSTGTTLPKTTDVKKEMKPSETTEELPLTGVNSTLFALFAAVIALFVIARRRRA
jgi:citrate lyase alpha subunit